MKQVVDRHGNKIAQVDDENRIVNGHNRIKASQQLGIELFIRDSDNLIPIDFRDGTETVH